MAMNTTKRSSGKSQLIVQHFMFGEDWDEGCPSCSFWADGFDGTTVHMIQRDAAFAAVSNAPYAKLAAYKVRMGWSFEWISAEGSTFSRDFGVTFAKEDVDRGSAVYNYRPISTGAASGPVLELPGVSVFVRNKGGEIFHTYSCFARGLDNLNVAYQYIDLLPKGRDEDGLSFSMAWVRRHDAY